MYYYTGRYRTGDGRISRSASSFIKRISPSSRSRKKPEVLLPDIPILALTPRDAFYSETEVVPFDESAGRIIAEFVMVYPPGIPIFIPGEIITEEI